MEELNGRRPPEGGPAPGEAGEPATGGRVTPGPVFLPALVFGAVLGGIIFAYRLKVGPPAGAGGGLADAALSGLSSAALYAFLYAFVQWVWRTKIRPLPGLTWKSRGTGFFSALVFLLAFLLAAVLGGLLI